jgi:imidazolonepropionase-like amidohydrolase
MKQASTGSSYTECGVKCIEHGQLIDERAAKLLADNGIFFTNAQPKSRLRHTGAGGAPAKSIKAAR